MMPTETSAWSIEKMRNASLAIGRALPGSAAYRVEPQRSALAGDQDGGAGQAFSLVDLALEGVRQKLQPGRRHPSYGPSWHVAMGGVFRRNSAFGRLRGSVCLLPLLLLSAWLKSARRGLHRAEQGRAAAQLLGRFTRATGHRLCLKRRESCSALPSRMKCTQLVEHRSPTGVVGSSPTPPCQPCLQPHLKSSPRGQSPARPVDLYPSFCVNVIQPHPSSRCSGRESAFSRGCRPSFAGIRPSENREGAWKAGID